MDEQLTKQQHYVPQFYLRNFLDDSQMLHGYNRVKKTYFPCHTEDICRKDWLYEICLQNTTPQEKKFILPNSTEKSFVDQEGIFDSLFKNIIEICSNPANKNALIFSTEEKTILHKFVLNLLFRNPWSLNQIGDREIIQYLMCDDRLKPIEELLKDLSLVDIYEPLVKMANQKVWLDDSLPGGMQEELIAQLSSMYFCVLKSDNNSFITSDFPILYDSFGKNDMPLFKTLFFSISPRFAIIYGQSNRAKDYRNRINDISDRKEIVLKLNNWYLGQNSERSKFLFAQNKNTLESIVNHR